MVAGGAGFGDGGAVEKGDGGGLGFFFKIGEVHEAADGGFGDGAAAIDIFAAVEGGDESPVVGLFDFAGEGVVVALGAIDAGAVDDGGDGLGDLLVFIFALVEEPGGALGGVGSGFEKGAHRFGPGPVVAEGVFEEGPPALVAAAVFAAVFEAAAHEEDVPKLAHVQGVGLGGEEAVDEVGAPGSGGGLEKGVLFGGAGDASGEVEGDAARPGAVVEGRRRGEAALLPSLAGEGVHGFGDGGEGAGWGRRGGWGGGGGQGEGGDVVADGGALGFGDLLFGGHVGIRAGSEHLVEGAGLGVARDEDGALVAALEEGLGGIEFEAAFLFEGAVALGALAVEERLQLGGPEGGGVGGGG